MIHHQDDHLAVHIGDCRDVLASLPAESVHCVVTSPPYWGLRDYGEPGQLGLEPTPEEYVASMVEVFREVRRVLRKDGTCWVNLGDSYASHNPGGYREGEFLNPGGQPPVKGQARNRAGNYRPGGLKPKDLVGIPWRVAFALQADGWYLRSDIIWSKPNPMPESVTDRPTKAHEYLFLLTKSARYFYDAEAVRENWTSGRDDMREKGVRTGLGYFEQEPIASNSHKQDGHGRRHLGFNARWAASEDNRTAPMGRNLRDVWSIATEPYPGAHFATFPQKLVEPCIKAGCPLDGTVLDPFAGSGTTGLVANRLGRRAILIDLSADYIDQAMLRNQQAPLGLTP